MGIGSSDSKSIDIDRLKRNVLDGCKITKEEASALIGADLNVLCGAADEIRQHFCSNSFDLCTIINGKSGKCPEDCKYCAQSIHYASNVLEYGLLDAETIQNAAKHHEAGGILRFSVVTSGRKLGEIELLCLCKYYQTLSKECSIKLCASHGLLDYWQLVQLKAAGVERYHCNLETSRRNFPNICTTHTYEDKLQTIKLAQKAGLEVCSGGIIGLMETMEDRIDMAMELRDLKVRSVPLNLLNPIKGTPLEDLPVVDESEFRRVAAIFRFILPDAAIRLAGGRGLLKDQGRSLFWSGANAAISGDMLTTAGISTGRDLDMIRELGYEVNRL